MNVIWKTLLVVAGVVAARETYIALGPRRWRRREAFAKAQARADQTGKPLIVIGDPDSGVVHRVTGRDYGCGHTCVDLAGCPRCEVQLQGKLEDVLATMANDSAVVFVSCVLEYVDDPQGAIAELNRVSGGDLYVVTVEPLTLTAFFYPGAKHRFFEAPPESRRFAYKTLPWAGGKGAERILPAATVPQVLPRGMTVIDTDGESVP